ncbi:hypothetical protein HMPREF1986_00587 [Oribacterium sp. oral taxon 078 str. F0263]|nr:hypothetical protein HMPREF1986_00587 [Oribacterium sp. oral taxon 078 str. F0263]
MSENYAVHICRTAICKAMKRTGTMVLLSSHSPGWDPDHAMEAAAGDPRGGVRPMELKAFSRLMTSRSLGCRGKISEKEMNVTPPALLRPAVIHIQTFL